MTTKGPQLSAEQMERIDICLRELYKETNACCVLLSDVSGQLISEQGPIGRMNTTVLSALAAGDIAATREMANLVGEKARFKLLLHEGEGRSVYLSDVGEELILVTVATNETPIGLVRLFLKQTVENVKDIIAEQATGPDAEGAIDADFGQLLADELDISLSD